MNFYLLLINAVLLPTVYSVSQKISSHVNVWLAGTRFEPVNPIEMLSNSTARSFFYCSATCNKNPQCRTLNYNSVSKQCILFEGAVSTGTVLVNNTSSWKVGSVHLTTDLYKCYNQTAVQCDFNRYIVEDAVTGLGVCPNHTYWTGTMCSNQVYLGSPCVSNAWCRTDALLRCVNISGMICQTGKARDDTHSATECRLLRQGFGVNLIINGNAETGPCSSDGTVVHPTSWNYTGLITQILYTNNRGALPSAVSKPR